MNEPCTIETGLFKKKPCGQTSVTRCANCEQPLCKAHAVAQKKPGVFMCKECTDAGHQYDKNQAAVAKAEKDKAQAEMLKSMMNPAAPKPKVSYTQQGGAAPKPAAAPAAKPAAPAADAPLEFTPSTKPKPADDAPLEFKLDDEPKK